MLSNLFISTAHAMAGNPGGQPAEGGGSLFASMLPLVAIFAIFYFLMIRPQQKQQKKHREMLVAMRKGDKVITRGGIHGVISSVNDALVTVEIANNVQVKLNRDAIAAVEAPKNDSGN